ncbi:MAG: group II intron reverse transcriptase/maturase [Cyanobacteria bacterium J06629_9]
MTESAPQISDSWKTVNGPQVQRTVFRLQQRIYRATQRGDLRTARSLQRLLLKSWSAKVLAVRRVTQDNQGKKTAGVDGVHSLKPPERVVLAKTLSLDKEAAPVRRVLIPKPGKAEYRKLGIPTMRDRAKQALAKLALEPQWEAQFEPNSYGFRPGRSPQDALEQVHRCISQRPKWVLDADIAACFDRIAHTPLVNQLTDSHPSITRQCKAWLAAGELVDNQIQTTGQGTPQGGVISPLLANIALHGLEDLVKAAIKGAHVVRFADDFVVLHPDRDAILKAKTLISQWLEEKGLALKEEKTRIAHTLNGGEAYPTGFDFLGTHVRQYPTSRRRMNKTQRPYKTLIKPSKTAIKRLVQTLSEVVTHHQGCSQAVLIEALNPIILGWANYHRSNVASRSFAYLDSVLYWQLRRWARRRHPNKSRKWVRHRYWHTVGRRNWVFGVRQADQMTVRLVRFSDVSIQRHIKVRGHKSWYDGDWAYWATRRGRHPMVSYREAALLKRQRGRCILCRSVFDIHDAIEVDHVWPKARGGKENYANLQLVHRSCHHHKTRWDEQGYCPIRPWRVETVAEEPCEGKPSRTVLKAGGSS